MGAVRHAKRPSDKLVRFAAGVNTGLEPTEAARQARYADSTIAHVGRILDDARAAGLILTIAEATAPLDAIRAVVKPEDWRDVAVKALADAKAGDRNARQWLSDYLIGKAAQPVEHKGKLEFVFSYEGEPVDDDNDDD